MTDYILHTPESASEQGSEALERARRGFGFAPNLLRVLAEAPAAAHAYLDLGGRLANSSLSPVEQQVVLLATSYENACDYCMAAHSAVARRLGIAEADLLALREGGDLGDPRLNALRDFTRAVVRDRGRVTNGDLERFLGAGFTRANVLEVVLGVAMKTLSNYTNHIARTPLDEVFESYRWTAPVEVATG